MPEEHESTRRESTVQGNMLVLAAFTSLALMVKSSMVSAVHTPQKLVRAGEATSP